MFNLRKNCFVKTNLWIVLFLAGATSYAALEKPGFCENAVALTKSISPYNDQRTTAIQLYNKFTGLRQHFSFLLSLDFLSAEKTFIGSHQAAGSKKIEQLTVGFSFGWNQSFMGKVQDGPFFSIRVESDTQQMAKSKFKSLIENSARELDIKLKDERYGPTSDADVDDQFFFQMPFDKGNGIDQAMQLYKSVLDKLTTSQQLVTSP